MAKNTFNDFSTTASSNTDIAGIDIQGTAAVANFDNALRTLMAILRTDLDNGQVFVTKAAGYTALAADNNAFYEFTAAATLALTAAATLAADWHMTVFANGGAVTIDPDGAELINGAATLVVADGDAAYIICTGTAFKAVTIPAVANLATRVDTAAAQSFTAAQQAQGRSNISAALKGHINGLTLSNNATDATNDIDIAAGEAASTETDPVLMVLASGLTKRLDAAWAVGTGNGGLDTGSIADTTYHVWLIQRSDTGVVDVLFSASASSPTMPTNYDRKVCIGSIIRQSASIVPFIQDGNIFTINAVADVSSTNPGISAVSRTLTVPSGVRVVAFGSLTLFGANNGTVYAALLSALDLGDQNPTASNCQVGFTSAAASNRQTGSFQVPTNTSSQIRSRLALSEASTVLTITTRGWIDPRL